MFATLTLQAMLLLVPAPREKEGPDKGPGFLGIAYDEDDGNGFLITEIYADSPAKKGGMLVGDRILSFGGKKPGNTEDFVRRIVRTRPGTVLDFQIQRGNEKKTLKVKVGVRPEDFPFPLPEPEDPEPKKDEQQKKDPPPKKEEPKDEAKKEEAKNADAALTIARGLIEVKPQRALERLEDLVKKYPDTKAAGNAKELIKQLKKQ